MRHPSLKSFLSRSGHLDAQGPVALVLLEDDAEVTATVEHCKKIGFREVVVFGAADLLPSDIPDIHTVVQTMTEPDAMQTIVNGMIRAYPGTWFHYCYNAEFLMYPFCETRSVGEMIAFSIEERRDAVLTFVVDLYSTDLGQDPNGVSRDNAHFDKAGYYALARSGADGAPADRQLDFFGGLRWRFEEHVPWERRRIDRVGLFKAAPGLAVQADHTFNMAEYNTYSCEWHNNISATICSFRTAKALLSNPSSQYAIPHFWWKNSAPFEWSSRQLMDLGLMEPGQWF